MIGTTLFPALILMSASVGTPAMECDGSTWTYLNLYFVSNDSDEPLEFELEFNIPSGKEVTGECIAGECQTVDAGVHLVTKTIEIPPWANLTAASLKITYAASIYIVCGPFDPCPDISIPVCDIKWNKPQFTYFPCPP